MNTRNLLTVLPLLAAGALLTPHVAAAAPSASSATPQALSLTLKDVQHVYGGSFRPFIVNTYKASHKGGCGGNYTGGYLAMFGNFKKASSAGAVVSIESTVFAYASSSSTTCALQARAASMSRAGTRIAGMKTHTSQLSGVGDSAYVSTISVPKSHSYTVIIDFARGTHIATVMVSAVRIVPAQSSAVVLASVVDGRIQAAG